MKAIILAGGYAKRMWPLTKDKPKHLLPIAGKPMLSYVLERVNEVENVDTIYISTNAKFKTNFEEFIEAYLPSLREGVDMELKIEDTFSEGEKLGSVGALNFLIRSEDITDDLMIVGGDNLFEYDMNGLLKFFNEKSSDVIAVYDVGSYEIAKLYGILEVDEDDRIISFVEKPEEPKSTLSATACYMLTKTGVSSIKKYIDEGNSPDAMGLFIAWLIKKRDVYAYSFEGRWFDIGGFESLEEAERYYSERE
ncbi:MAG: nucleotidyltransferase family protein [Halobacteriota archaeon]|nr:nucleotidyltransferase family protein [Halobacteriota archaeon]